MTQPRTRFDFLHEAEVPPGAEGWQRMYPYYLVSQPEGHELEDARFWFADSMHWSRAVHPFDSIGAEAVYLGVGVSSMRTLVLPQALGLDVRMVNGYVYICSLPVTDPAEIAPRARHFEPRAAHCFGHWNAAYEQWKGKMTEVIDRMRALRFDPLPQVEPIEVVTEGRVRGSGSVVPRRRPAPPRLACSEPSLGIRGAVCAKAGAAQSATLSRRR